MFKNLLQFEAKVQDWVSHWNIPANLPLDVAKEMAFILVKFIGQIEDQAKAQQAAQAQAPEAPKEEAAPQEFPEPQEVPKSE